jgi:thiol-disulfide isomerase/thioredoxin/uncharacterized membrane protein YphA (DoxX/SURF4 family)
MDLFVLLIRIFLAAVLAAAGIGKLLDPEGSEKAVRDFGVPAGSAKIFSVALPIFELVFAACLLFTQFAWLGAIGAAALFVTFTGAMMWQIARGRSPDCHCFGALHSEPVSVKTLIRNMFFAALALFLAARGRTGQGLGFADLTDELALNLILGLAAVGLLGAAVFYLKKISGQQDQIIRRIELLEAISHIDGGREIEREDVISPHDGLPIGAPAPDFAARDLGGRLVSLESLLVVNRPMLLFFVSPSCVPCQTLVPEFERWQNDLRDKINFVFISKGKEKENREKFGGTNFEPILLQNENEIAESFKAVWTPTALLLDANGNIASHIAAGDGAIRALIEKIGLLDPEAENFFVAGGAPVKIGEPLPEFSAADLDGKTVSSKDLVGRKILLTYWSLDCGWCEKMLGGLREWEKTRRADEPELVLLSSGNADRHRRLGLAGRIILDDEKNISKELGMNGTPSAVLIDEKGKIASEVAVGAEKIFALVGRKDYELTITNDVLSVKSSYL